MKLELNVVRMTNEDVIATSGTLCTADLYYFNGSDKLLYYVNNSSVSSQDVTTQFSSNLPTSKGYYHYDGSQFVECPVWNGNCDDHKNTEDVYAAHGRFGG